MVFRNPPELRAHCQAVVFSTFPEHHSNSQTAGVAIQYAKYIMKHAEIKELRKNQNANYGNMKNQRCNMISWQHDLVTTEETGYRIDETPRNLTALYREVIATKFQFYSACGCDFACLVHHFWHPGRPWDDPGMILGHWKAQKKLCDIQAWILSFLNDLIIHFNTLLNNFTSKKNICSYLFSCYLF